MVNVRYLVERTIYSVVLLWLVITFLFFFFRLMPGSYADLMLFSGASEDTIVEFERRWGLDQPLYVQYFIYMENLLTLDAGTSLQYRTPVWEYTSIRILNSLVLILPGITAAYIAGTLFGTLLGKFRGTKLEKYGIIPILLTGTLPSFFTAILLIIIFSSWLGWFPTSGRISAEVARDLEWWQVYFTRDFLMHYTLPVTAVFLRYLFLPSLIMRTSVVETLRQDFVEYHRLTGIPMRTQYRHIGKNSILPVITMFPVSTTRAIGGLVLIETVFNWPGIGFALVDAVLSRDFPIVQFVFFLIAVYIVFANYLVDLLYGVIDPRISVGGDSD